MQPLFRTSDNYIQRVRIWCRSIPKGVIALYTLLCFDLCHFYRNRVEIDVAVIF